MWLQYLTPNSNAAGSVGRYDTIPMKPAHLDAAQPRARRLGHTKTETQNQASKHQCQVVQCCVMTRDGWFWVPLSCAVVADRVKWLGQSFSKFWQSKACDRAAQPRMHQGFCRYYVVLLTVLSHVATYFALGILSPEVPCIVMKLPSVSSGQLAYHCRHPQATLA